MLLLCCLVLGYVYGGVGELLVELYLVGCVLLGDCEKLVECVVELLCVVLLILML